MASRTHVDKRLQKEQRIHNPLLQRLFTLKQAAAYLGRSEWAMRDLIWKQLIPVVKNSGGRKIFIDIRDLDDYVEKNKMVYS
jgi:hypothetical protein